MMENRINQCFCAGLLVLSALLAGCSSSVGNNQILPGVATNEPIPPLGNVEYHTFQLANELFAQVRPSRQTRYAVVSFVPMPENTFDVNDQHPLRLLGHQLREGLITEAAKRGFSTQEFLLTNDINISDMQDRVLSRDFEELSDVQRVDYYITGTVLHQQEGAIVNARIVHVRNKEVIAAATRFFPAELFWREEQVTSRQGRLYRTIGNTATR